MNKKKLSFDFCPKIKKQFRSFFGSNESKKICFRNQLTSTVPNLETYFRIIVLIALQLSKFKSHLYYAKVSPNPIVFDIVSWPIRVASSSPKFKADVIWPGNVLPLFDITQLNKNIRNPNPYVHKHTANVLSAESTEVCLRTKSQDNWQ